MAWYSRVLKSLVEARLELESSVMSDFIVNMDKVMPILSPSSKRFLSILSILLDISPILSKFKPFTLLSSSKRKEWIREINAESFIYDIINTLDTVALAIYSLTPRFQESIGYNRLKTMREAKIEERDEKLTYKHKPKSYYDVVVIGSGAGGAIVAWELARRGFSVALFEAGPEPSTREFILEHPIIRALKYYWDNGLTFTWGTPTIHLPFGKVLGGTVTVNSGTLFRAPEEALRIWYKETGFNIDSSSLNSAYSIIEDKLKVKPVPESLLGGNALVMRNGSKILGLKHGPTRRPIEGCMGLGECAFGCPSSGKLDMRQVFIREAVSMGLHVFTNSMVRKIIMRNDRARGVVVDVNGVRVNIESKITVVSAGALNTPRLLRASGISNRNIGKHLHIHPATGVVALMDYKVRGWIGTMQSYYVEDLLTEYKTLLLATFPPPGLGYSAGSIPLSDLYKYEYLASIGVQTSDDNTGYIASKQILGIANYNLSIIDLEKIKEGIILSSEILEAAGAKKIYLPLKKAHPASSTSEVKKLLKVVSPKIFKLSAYHPMATARIGRDPEIGVVDEKGRVYGYDNLYIADASIIPSTTIVNPQLTVNAISLIIADSIAKEL